VVFAALCVAGVAGCKSRVQRAREGLVQQLQSDPTVGSQLCGYTVAGLSGVSVRDVQLAGTESDGTGTAAVTGTPATALPGLTAGPCAGTVTYQYFRSTQWRGARRAGTLFQVYNINVVARTGAVPPALAGYAPAFAPQTAVPATAQGAGPVPLALGTVVAGALADTDQHLPDGRVADDYLVTLAPGQSLTFVVRGGPSVSTPGSTLDVYAMLLLNGTELAHDDDSAGYPNSRILFTATTAGTYTLRVSTFGGALRLGAYTLQTWPFSFPAAR
jgi:hypothetical protein